MANKTYMGASQTNASTTNGDYSNSDNWLPISLVNSSYQWTASGSGTNEFYLEANGGGNPSIDEPNNVQELLSGTRTNLTEATAGSLAAGQWDWADNDTLGFSTVYVRLTAGSGDPDSSDDSTITYTAIPVAADNVRIPADASQPISSGLDQSGVAIGDFIVEDGYSADIGLKQGSNAQYLQINPNRFEYNGGGRDYIDIGSANIVCRVYNTGSAAIGDRALYLKGSNISTLEVRDGFVGVASQHGETATVATVRQSGGDTWLGEGASITTVDVYDGQLTLNCAATTCNVYGGALVSEEEGAITTVNAHGGTAILNSTGTVTTLNLEGGIADLSQSNSARTVTTTNINENSGGLVASSAVTFTNRNWPSKPFQFNVTAP